MKKIKPSSLLKLFLKIGFTAVLVYFVLKKIDPAAIKITFQKSNPALLLLAFIIFFISQIASAWRLLSFLKNIGLTLTFGFNFRLYLLGMFYNIFLPGGIGGDGYKIYLLKKKFQLPVKKIFTAIFFDRLSGLWAVGLLASIIIMFIPQSMFPGWWMPAIFLPGTLIYFLITHRYFSVFTRNFFSNHLKAIIVQSLQVLSVMCILLAINYHGSFLPYIFVFLVSAIVSLIPFTIGGLGARETVMVYAAMIFNIDKETGVFISATFWLLTAIASLSGAYYAYNTSKFINAPENQ